MVVVLHGALALLSLATAISGSRLPARRHAKRLFGLHFDPLTTTTTAPVAEATSVTTIVQDAQATTTTTAAAAASTEASTLGTLIYHDLTAIPDGDDRLAIWTLSTLSAQACHDLCATASACNFYNIYLASSARYHGSSTPSCALYRTEQRASEATDTGAAAKLSYTQSDGYAMSSSGTAANPAIVLAS